MMTQIHREVLLGRAPSDWDDIYPVLRVAPGYLYYWPEKDDLEGNSRQEHREESVAAGYDVSTYPTMNRLVDLWTKICPPKYREEIAYVDAD